MLNNNEIKGAMKIQLGNEYPDYPEFQEGIRTGDSGLLRRRRKSR